MVKWCDRGHTRATVISALLAKVTWTSAPVGSIPKSARATSTPHGTSGRVTGARAARNRCDRCRTALCARGRAPNGRVAGSGCGSKRGQTSLVRLTASVELPAPSIGEEFHKPRRCRNCCYSREGLQTPMLSPILYLNTAPSVQSPLGYFARRGGFAFQSFRCSSEFLRKFRHCLYRECVLGRSCEFQTLSGLLSIFL